MILSYKNKFVFLKNSKVAGTSIEVALSSICGIDDVITPIGLKDELFRIQEYDVHCQNAFISKLEEELYVNRVKALATSIDKKKIEMEPLPSLTLLKYYNHMHLCDVLAKSALIPDDFLFVHTCRNPYEQIISWAEWLLMNYGSQWETPHYSRCDIKNKLDGSLEGIIKSVKVNVERIKHKDSLTTFVLRYESLQDDFNSLLDFLGYPNMMLPHVKKSKRDKSLDLNFFDREEIMKINDELDEYFSLYQYSKI